METSDLNFVKEGFRKRSGKFQPEGMVKTCPHCGQGKKYRHGRFWTPCSVCRGARINPTI